MGEVDLLQVSAAGGALAPTQASGSLSVLPPAVLFDAARRAGADLKLVLRQPVSGSVAVVVFRAGTPTMVFLPGDGRSLGELLLAAGDIDMTTLDALVQGRVQASASLENLLHERPKVPAARVRQLLDFQARARLLEVLAWREGFFELQNYSGGGETAFNLELPSLDALLVRARAREVDLPGLLLALPAPPELTLVRRKRGGPKAADSLGLAVMDALGEPRLIPQVVARLLVDDDLVIGAVSRLAAARAVTLHPRAALARAADEGGSFDPRLASVVREVLARTRSGAPAAGQATLTAVVVSANAADGVRFVERLAGGAGGSTVDEAPAAPTGMAAKAVSVGDGVRLSLLAIRPEALSRGALEGILSRFDALLLLRRGEEPAELDRLHYLRSVARGGSLHEPLTVGIDLGARLRDWREFPDAVVGLLDWEERRAEWLVERLVEALLAATTVRFA